MRKIDFLLKDTRNTSSYHFRSILPKDLRIIFNGRPSFTISLRTGNYKDALAKSIILYNITQPLFSKIRILNKRCWNTSTTWKTNSGKRDGLREIYNQRFINPHSSEVTNQILSWDLSLNENQNFGQKEQNLFQFII